MALHWLTRISIVSLLALCAAGCGRVEVGAELPEAIMAGETLEGEEANAAFASWARGVGSEARMPVHVVYDLEFILEVEDEDATGFTMEMEYALTLLDGARGRLELTGAMLDQEETIESNFTGTVVFDGETVWAWGSVGAGTDAGGFAPTLQEGAASFQQLVLEEFYAQILELGEANEASGGNFPRDRYPEPGSFLVLLHPTTYLWISEPPLVCEELRLRGKTLESTLGFDADQMDAEEWERAMEQIAAAPQAAGMVPFMESWMDNVYTERVPARFDADSGILREVRVDWTVQVPVFAGPEPPKQDAADTAMTDARLIYSMKLKECSFEVPSEDEVLARPEDLAPTDVTGLVQPALQLILQNAAAGAGAEDPVF